MDRIFLINIATKFTARDKNLILAESFSDIQHVRHFITQLGVYPVYSIPIINLILSLKTYLYL
jgi:hypothetical protein